MIWRTKTSLEADVVADTGDHRDVVGEAERR